MFQKPIFTHPVGLNDSSAALRQAEYESESKKQRMLNGFINVKVGAPTLIAHGLVVCI